MTDLLREKTITKEYSFFSIKQGIGRRRGIPENDRHSAIGMLEGGMSVNAVAISFESTAAPFGDFPNVTGQPAQFWIGHDLDDRKH